MAFQMSQEFLSDSLFGYYPELKVKPIFIFYFFLKQDTFQHFHHFLLMLILLTSLHIELLLGVEKSKQKQKHIEN